MKVWMQNELNKIKELLVTFSRYVELENSNGEFGINKTAENIIAGLLNIVFECRLKNMNEKNSNYPAIDLADLDKKIVFQVTSENARKKILKTLGTFKSQGLYLQYDKVYIYILGKKKKYKDIQTSINKQVDNKFIFLEKQILDYEDIYVLLSNCQDMDKITAVRKYLESHLGIIEKYTIPIASKIWDAGEQELKLLLGEDRFTAVIKESGEREDYKYSHGISEKLFPRGFLLPQYYEGYGVTEEGVEKPLSDLYKEYMDRNLILLGEGGIGKTTFLIHMMKTFYENKKESFDKVPIYIELNRCPAEIGMWYSDRYKKTNFITRYIAAMLDGGDYDQIKEDRLNQIEEELRRKNEEEGKKYVLLLDGFNEVSRNQTKNKNGNTGQSIRETLRREISVLSTYGNITLILTSRKMDKAYLPGNMEVLYLKGLNTEDIRNYLHEVDYSEVEINEIERSSELVECLQIPLFLCMFACRNKNKKIRPLTRGEILYNFFHKESPFYGEQKNIKNSFSKEYEEQILISFVMDFILPYIGNMMEGAGEFHIHRSDILGGIEYFLQDDEVPFWNPQIEVFREYEKEEFLENVRSKIRKVPVKQIMDCMVGTLGIINFDGRGGYSFIHHHVRDYFSSIYEIQWLRCAVALRYREKRNSEPSFQVLSALGSIRDEIWSETKQIFVGEILSEHRNIPVVNCEGKWECPAILFPEQRLLKEIINIFRNNKAYPGRCIFNILEIWKKVRKNLSGEDFSGLDLRECRFYETVCSIGEGKYQLAASFKNAIISNDTFYYQGHLGGYEDFQIIGDRAYTLGADERVLIWDLESYQCLKSFDVGNTFYPDTHVEDRQIVVGKEDFLVRYYEYIYTPEGNQLSVAEIRCYDKKNQNYLKMECPVEPVGIWDMRYSASGNFIASIWEENHICIYGHEDGKIRYSFQIPTEGKIKHIAMPEEDIVVLHIENRVEEAEETKDDRIYRSSWSFEIISLQDMSMTRIASYETMYGFNNEYQRPVFSFSASGWEALIFEDGKVKLMDLKNRITTEIQKIPDNKIPKSVQFLNDVWNYIAIHYEENYVLYNLLDATHAVYTGKVLDAAKKVALGVDYIYVLNSAVELMEWDYLNEQKVRRILPLVELNIIGITSNTAAEEVYIQYSNNSVLIIDEKRGELKTSIYYPEYSMEMEYCDYLIDKNLFFMVFSNEESEEIILYSLKNGQSVKIHVDFKSRLRFHGVITGEYEMYIAFDKKVVGIKFADFQMFEIWSAGADEELLSINERNEEMRILINKTNLKNIPYYNVYNKDKEGEYRYICRKPVIFTNEEIAQKMIPLVPQEFVGYYSDVNVSLFKKQGIFLDWDEEINNLYQETGISPWELSTVFYSVSDFAKSMSLESMSQQHWQLEDVSGGKVIIVEDYSKILIYKMDNGKVIYETGFSIDGRDESILGVRLGGDNRVYCRLEDDTLVVVDRFGKIIKEYNWIPGLIIAGCDFRGVVADKHVRENLREHGGIV